MKFLKSIKNINVMVTALSCVLAMGVLLSSCKDDEGEAGDVQLKAFGPSPVMRGGELQFVGSNLNKVSSIMLPGGVEVTSFESQTPGLIVIKVPEATVNGPVTLITSQGEIVTKTELGIAEPITITSITPASVRPGGTITIQGTYLNLVKEIIFADKKSVTTFQSQSQSSLTVVVPADAQTGKIVLSNGKAEPILVESANDVQVILPAVTGMSPNPVKAGTPVTISGTNLDLVKDITFGGNVRVTSDKFTSVSKESIVLDVPADVKDGVIKLRPASTVEVTSPAALTMVAPVITEFTPNPAKNKGTLTIKGTDLDLITSVVFGGGHRSANPEAGGTATLITVKVPAEAKDSILTFNTRNKAVVSSTALTLVTPTITNFTPLSVNTVANPSVTINGTDLDLVASVVFGDNKWSTPIASATTKTATQIVIPVAPGGITGKIKLITTNGTEIVTSQDLTIVPDVPNVTGPGIANTNEMLTLTGTNMSVIADIYFPGNVLATKYGAKTSTSVQVFVPKTGIKLGPGKIKFVTIKNEVYESPEINFLGLPTLATVIYDDAAKNGFGQWGGFGSAVTDFSSTEQVRGGDKAIKVTYPGSNWAGGAQFGGGNLSTTGATKFAFSVYGGAGTNGKKLQVLVKRTGGEASKQVTIVEGTWTDFEIPLSDLGNPANITELFFQNADFASTPIYIDHIGLK